MNPLNQLRKSILKDSTTTGVVTAIRPNSVLLTCHRGLEELMVANPSQFKVGDHVRYKDGALLGKSTGTDNLPVFNV